MAIQKARVTIEGISPLIMHRFPLEPIEALEKKPREEQAALAAYINGTNEYYVPGPALQRALIAGATYSKGKGRSTLQKAAAACVFIAPEYLILSNQEYEIDSRPVVVPATRGRVIRHRPKFTSWSVEFELEWDDILLTSEQVRRVVDDTGRNVGILDFRPERKGPYGRFVVTHWAAM